MELNKIYCEDCFETMSRMKNCSIDTIVTSPPYNKTGFRNGNLGHSNDWDADINYSSHEDNMDEGVYWDWQNSLFNEFYRILKPTGSLFYNHKVRRYKGKAHHPISELHNKMTFYQQITWDRGASVDNNINYLQPSTELLLWYVKDSPKVFKDNAVCRNEVWRIPAEKNNEHPAPFPVKLAANAIVLTSEKDDIIYDPFMGSGNTAIASHNNNRNWIGSEISQEYADLANRRLQPYVNQQRLF